MRSFVEPIRRVSLANPAAERETWSRVTVGGQLTRRGQAPNILKSQNRFSNTSSPRKSTGHSHASGPEEVHNMHRFRILAGLLLGAALLIPTVVRADGDDHRYNKRYYDNRRYFDRDGRDYHVWNEREDRAYRFYLNDQHLGDMLPLYLLERGGAGIRHGIRPYLS